MRCRSELMRMYYAHTQVLVLTWCARGIPLAATATARSRSLGGRCGGTQPGRSGTGTPRLRTSGTTRRRRAPRCRRTCRTPRRCRPPPPPPPVLGPAQGYHCQHPPPRHRRRPSPARPPRHRDGDHQAAPGRRPASARWRSGPTWPGTVCGRRRRGGQWRGGRGRRGSTARWPRPVSWRRQAWWPPSGATLAIQWGCVGLGSKSSQQRSYGPGN
jgi:hypothetical protein